MTITSTAIQASDYILPQYTCDGEDISPPLTFSEVPKDAKSLILIMDDPDAPGGTFTHWLLYDLSPATLQIPEKGQTLTGKSGLNGFGKLGYGGPCPPSGTHHYNFKLYALDQETGLAEGVSVDEVNKATKGHVIESAQLVGLYKRN